MKIIAISYLKQLNLFDDKSKITSYVPYNQIVRFDLINNNYIDIILTDKTSLTLNGLVGYEDLEALLEHIHNTKDTVVYIDKFIEEYKSGDSSDKEDGDDEVIDTTEERTRNRFQVIDE
jgi:hypothetical protein